MSLMTCYHPLHDRWVSTCGHVEVCGRCSEARRVSPDGIEFWPAAARRVRIVGDEVLTFSLDETKLYRRERVRFTTERLAA